MFVVPPPPTHVRPLLPERRNKPKKYLCPENYLETLLAKISDRLEESDGGDRVPPMALVGCSRSGKTATLEQIAAALPDFLAARNKEPVTVICVTFNDYSPFVPDDSKDLLQEFCQRFVFAVKQNEWDREIMYYEEAYEQFCKEGYTINPFDIKEWLGNTRSILLIDEINNLNLKESRTQSVRLGNFIRSTFLSRNDRYLIFTNHALGTVTSFGDILDSSDASSQTVVVERLPVTLNLDDVLVYLNPDLRGPLEALYHGLLPGMIYDQRKGPATNMKQAEAVVLFNQRPMKEKEGWIKKILRSLYSGNIEDVPPEFHNLLTTRPLGMLEKDSDDDSDLAKVSWVPSTLRYVLRRTQLEDDSWLVKAKNDLAKVCLLLQTARWGSGKGYEYLFTIAYLSRSIARLPFDDFLPAKWTKIPGVQVMFNPYMLARQGVNWFQDCKTWLDLEKGIDVDGPQPTIAVFLPEHEFFARYDVIALLIENNTIIDQRAFQLKQAKSDPSVPPLPPFENCSFLIKGVTANETFVNNLGWIVPSNFIIELFFGESGRYWTPKVWNILMETFNMARKLSQQMKLLSTI
ncbi:hypothetical protein MPSEU_000866300 [Mayamaea pseudoterrestris]|nr:hypothetical protein MPSEU_000866300 [Mayamaea pseudoterrestris]